ncbi:uncharacterized protein BJX67DRAFT_379571 [Aspergillus lucknowensis]|uniref:GPI anchored protein n=1 Tax=Aspergillus lucknowensis TaxID=176173 RepID=A0ABR4LX25_9EURO
MYFLHYMTLCLMSTVGALSAEVTASVNSAELQNAADQLLSMFPSATPFTATFTVPGGNLLQPPPTLVKDIITAVPPTVLAQLLMPTGRSSIASEFKAGNTPDWYQELPSEVKNYVLAMKSQVGAGNVNLSATPTEAAATSGNGDGDGDAAATETSSGVAARATGYVAASMVSVLGLLGVAVVL